jgi:SpoVK/Ycf46/Vps4 family AAA+-type ATPase
VSAPTSILDARTFPDSEAARRFEALVGLDDTKRELLAALRVALRPAGLREWARKQPEIENLVQLVLRRPALFVLGGDVGSGKTELAETIGDSIARAEGIGITLFSLSLAARGTGFVGEMTQRIIAAFDEVRGWGEKRKDDGRSKGSAGILFIDEADAIAQSREASQMHHEDRAGVNALIRGIDDLTRAGAPVAVIMATNRLDEIDPAVRRRAAALHAFRRPDDAQRRALFVRLLPRLEPDRRLPELVAATGARAGAEFGFTYSDITQRLVPSAVLKAYEVNASISIDTIIDAARQLEPTPPFRLEARAG